jgi:hypothetical protein
MCTAAASWPTGDKSHTVLVELREQRGDFETAVDSVSYKRRHYPCGAV